MMLAYGLWVYNPIARAVHVAFTVLGIAGALFTASSAGSGGQGSPLFAVVQVGLDLAILWALMAGSAKQIFTQEYRNSVQDDTPFRVPFWTSPFFWAPFLFGCLISCVVLYMIGRGPQQ
jgi:hypothetical protein